MGHFAKTNSSKSAPKGMSRRSFLKTSGGVIAMTVIGLPTSTTTKANAQSWSPTPGIATQRVEGLTKVTGGKIYARDYNARDLANYGWPQQQWYAMYLRALNVTYPFLGVDLSKLDPTIRPRKTVLGSDFATGILSPRLLQTRDRIIDDQIFASYEEAVNHAITTGSQLDHPDTLEFDLVVQPNNRADYLGQAVALLLFDDVKKYRAAKRQMQFDDAAYQIYGTESVPAVPSDFTPLTQYVKETDTLDPTNSFSYYTNATDYTEQLPTHVANIDDYLANTPGLITKTVTSDMRAMDPMFMEPESGLVWFDENAKQMNLLLGTQSPDGDLAHICNMYGECEDTHPVEKAFLISCYPGGGFGGRDSSPFSLMLALTADFADGNPVKLEYDRFEQFRVGLKRHACDLTGTVAATPDQKLQVVKMDMTFDGGGRKNLSPYVAQLACLCAGGSYDLPMANISGKAIHTENISGGSQRGFGGPQAFFAIETASDDICADQLWDPIAFRLNNTVAEGDTTVVGGPIQQQLRLNEMLTDTALHPLWRDREDIKEGYAQRGKLYGTGVAMSLQAYGTSGDGVVAAITLEADGTWSVQSDAVDMGNGSATTLGVVIGPILGSNAARVEMGGYTLFKQTGLIASRDIGSADCTPPDPPKPPPPTWDDAEFTKQSVGSSSACLTGLHQVHVVQQTALAVMAQTVIPAAEYIWGINGITEQDVEWVDGTLMLEGYPPLALAQLAEVANNPDISVARGVVAHAYFQESWISADFNTPIGVRRYGLDGMAVYPSDNGPAVPNLRFNTQHMDCQSARESRYVWSPCVNVIGLTVDPDTGAVQVENILSVLNAGRVHVPALVSGQSQGGVAMAMGWTLHEDMPPGMDGPANGTWNLNRYHVPRYHDVPLATEYAQGGRAQELVIMTETDGDKKQGRGIAEAVMCSIAPAISNAIKDATGKRFTSLPITPTKILEGLRT